MWVMLGRAQACGGILSQPEPQNSHTTEAFPFRVPQHLVCWRALTARKYCWSRSCLATSLADWPETSIQVMENRAQTAGGAGGRQGGGSRLDLQMESWLAIPPKGLNVLRSG